MTNQFIYLRAKRTWSIILEVVALQSRRGPAVVHQGQLDEKFATRQDGDLAKLFGTWKGGLTEEEDFVG
jgi:hypothetical protein